MSVGAIDRSRRNAARVAGFAYLISFAIPAFGEFSIQPRLIVPGNAAETARRIIAHERLFRLNIVFDLLYCAGTVVLLVALFAILTSVGKNLALLAMFFRLAYSPGVASHYCQSLYRSKALERRRVPASLWSGSIAFPGTAIPRLHVRAWLRPNREPLVVRYADGHL